MTSSTTERDCSEDPFQKERNQLHDVIQGQAKKLKASKRTIKDLKRRIALNGDGVFVTMNSKQLADVVRQAFADTTLAHGDKVQGNWEKSFLKRFWGRIKNLDNNERQRADEDNY